MAANVGRGCGGMYGVMRNGLFGLSKETIPRPQKGFAERSNGLFRNDGKTVMQRHVGFVDGLCGFSVV